MRYFILLLGVSALLSCQNQTVHEAAKMEPIQFTRGSLAEAVKESKQLQKPIFVAFHASWCPPCKQMEADVYSDGKTGAFFNKEFINYKIDAKDMGAKKTARKFGITNYPTLVFADSDGDNLMTSIGLIGADQLLDFGKEALEDYKKMNF